MISFVVPAHNEEGCLGRTLEAIHGVGRELGIEYEIVVADDASTDGTGDVARGHGARLVRVEHRQIAATRNSGARAALGERIFFVDADTVVNAKAVAAAIRVMDKGAVGGGAPVWVEGPVPLYVRVIELFGGIGCTLVGFTGGAFMFCTRAAFDATGGFNERVYWAEEGFMTMALRREGRFVVLWERVLTSGRRFRKNSGSELLGGFLKAIVSPVKMVTRRASVEKIWYDSDRTEDERMPSSLGVRISNGIALVVMLILVTGPLWNFVPHSLTPWSSALGKFRFVAAVLLVHAGLLLLPVAAVLLLNLLRQKRWTGILQSVLVITFCTWQGWGAANGVVWVWTEIGISVGSLF